MPSLIQTFRLDSLRQLYQLHVSVLPRAPRLRTFMDWITRGTKYAYLAGGGSIYALLLVAGMELKSVAGKSRVDVVWELGKMLRDPRCLDDGELVFLYHVC